MTRLHQAVAKHCICYAYFTANTIEKYRRDAHAASHHQGLSWDAAAEEFGRQALGLPPGPGRYG